MNDLLTYFQTDPQGYANLGQEDRVRCLLRHLSTLPGTDFLTPSNVLHHFGNGYIDENAPFTKAVLSAWQMAINQDYLLPTRGQNAVTITPKGKSLAADVAPRSLDELRKSLTEGQRWILETIWTDFRDGGNGIPRRDLFDKLGLEGAELELEGLGGTVVRERHDSVVRYQPTIIGILLTENCQDIEKMLIAFFEYVKRQVKSNSSINEIYLNGFRQDSGFREDVVDLLRRIFTDWCPPFFNIQFVSSDQGWAARLSKDADSLPYIPNLEDYIRKGIWERHDPAWPIEADKSFAYSQRKFRAGSEGGGAGLKNEPDQRLNEILRLVNFIQGKLRSAVHEVPQKELYVQNVLENLLIGQNFSKGVDYDRETGRVKVSIKEAVPDFIFHKLNLALEVKLSKNKGKSKEIVDEINADIMAYGTKYSSLFFVVYDLGSIRDVDEFKNGLEKEGSIRVIVVKH